MSSLLSPQPQPRPAERVAGVFRRLLSCAAGVSAVEFALLAPVLVIGAFGTADAGMAVHERMMIGQALRAGAARAMAGADEADIREALAAVASDNFAVAWEGAAQEDEPLADTLVLAIQSYCACPDAAFGQVSCAASCDSGADPSRFLRLSAGKRFSGIMLPEFPISGTVEILVE